MKKILTVIIGILVILGFVSVSILNRHKPEAPGQLLKEQVNNPSLSGLLSQAKDLEAKKDLLETRNIYQKLINEFPSSADIVSWQKKIEELNMQLLFSPVLVPNKSILYEIKPGDSLEKIAKLHKTNVDLIYKSNNMKDNRIFAGQKIKVWTAPFSILVYKGQNILILKSEDEIIKTYVVSTGANNCTPVGTFKIVNKLINPTWFKAGAVVAPESPQNVLGTRWMGFNLASYGIHGTIEPQNLGKQVTQGCVRMANNDVEELYSIVPVGTEVTIFE